MEETKELVVSEQQMLVAKQIDKAVALAMQNMNLVGFEKAAIQAKALQTIESLLTDEYLDPIIALQGKSIGFLTDKDGKEAKYKKETIKECVIEAVLTGLEVTGNQFNIIGGRMYVTKNGFTHLLKRLGVQYDLIYSPIKKTPMEGTTINVTIKWKLKDSDKQNSKDVIFSLKVFDGVGNDALLGKAERKAKKWLYEQITGQVIDDGDTIDATYSIVENTESITVSENIQEDRQSVQDVEVIVDDSIKTRAINYLKASKDNEDLKARYEIVKKQKVELTQKEFDEIASKIITQ